MYAHLRRTHFTTEQAAAVAAVLELDFTHHAFGLEDLRRGMDVELEHGSREPLTNVTDDDPVLTGKVALAHLLEMPDYYDRLDVMEHGA